MKVKKKIVALLVKQAQSEFVASTKSSLENSGFSVKIFDNKDSLFLFVVSKNPQAVFVSNKFSNYIDLVKNLKHRYKINAVELNETLFEQEVVEKKNPLLTNNKKTLENKKSRSGLDRLLTNKNKTSHLSGDNSLDDKSLKIFESNGLETSSQSNQGIIKIGGTNSDLKKNAQTKKKPKKKSNILMSKSHGLVDVSDKENEDGKLTHLQPESKDPTNTLMSPQDKIGDQKLHTAIKKGIDSSTLTNLDNEDVGVIKTGPIDHLLENSSNSQPINSESIQKSSLLMCSAVYKETKGYLFFETDNMNFVEEYVKSSQDKVILGDVILTQKKMLGDLELVSLGLTEDVPVYFLDSYIIDIKFKEFVDKVELSTEHFDDNEEIPFAIFLHLKNSGKDIKILNANSKMTKKVLSMYVENKKNIRVSKVDKDKALTFILFKKLNKAS